MRPVRWSVCRPRNPNAAHAVCAACCAAARWPSASRAGAACVCKSLSSSSTPHASLSGPARQRRSCGPARGAAGVLCALVFPWENTNRRSLPRTRRSRCASSSSSSSFLSGRGCACAGVADGAHHGPADCRAGAGIGSSATCYKCCDFPVPGCDPACQRRGQRAAAAVAGSAVVCRRHCPGVSVAHGDSGHARVLETRPSASAAAGSLVAAQGRRESKGQSGQRQGGSEGEGTCSAEAEGHDAEMTSSVCVNAAAAFCALRSSAFTRIPRLAPALRRPST